MGIGPGSLGEPKNVTCAIIVKDVVLFDVANTGR